MKSATINEIKKTLQSLDREELISACLRLAKYKKDNKELFHFLLYEASDEPSFISKVNEEMDELFSELPRSNAYLIKKMVRKILKINNKYIKHSNSKVVELDLQMYFIQKIKDQNFSNAILQSIDSIKLGLVKKIEKSISGLHEDLQYDYKRLLEKHLD